MQEFVTKLRSIKNNGITDLSNLIQNTVKSIEVNNKTKLANGQQFNQPINFKAYKSITNITIM